jgi:hypothetical protein
MKWVGMGMKLIKKKIAKQAQAGFILEDRKMSL